MATTSNTPPLPSSARFGALFASIFAAAAAFNFWKGELLPASAFALAAVILGILARVRPALLAPLNKAWFAFGLLLSRVVSPLVLGILFFLVITPVALIGRISGRDALRLKQRAANSYWIKREPAGPAPDSFKHQF